jgi:5-methylcytosine-specific restriction enzyme subunit McrC
MQSAKFMPKSIERSEHETILVGEAPGARITEGDVAQLLRAQGAATALGWIDRNSVRTSEQVGVIAAPSIRLEILPKIDSFGSSAARKVLVRMLANVWGITIHEGELAQMATQERDLLEIFIHLFALRLNTEVRKGLGRTYQQHRDDLPRLRGKLDAIRQYSRNAAYPQRLACVFDELTANTPLNRLLLCTVHTLRRRTNVSATEQLLRETAFHFEDVELLQAEVVLRERLFLPLSERRWRPVESLARLLLEGSYQATHLGVRDGIALLFDMNRLFESYVANLISKIAHRLGYVITEQGPHRGLVADSEGQILMSTRPDIHIDLDGRIIVLDTKWKQLVAKPALGITAEDLYQMHAYQRVYGASETILIFPKARVLGMEGSHEQWTFVESSKSLRVMGIDLEDPSNFTEAISALFGTVLTRVTGL